MIPTLGALKKSIEFTIFERQFHSLFLPNYIKLPIGKLYKNQVAILKAPQIELNNNWKQIISHHSTANNHLSITKTLWNDVMRTPVKCLQNKSKVTHLKLVPTEK